MRSIFVGTDSGATTCKTGAIYEDTGEVVSMDCHELASSVNDGKECVVEGWLKGVNALLTTHNFTWEQVAGVGVAIQGPFLSYGVLGKPINLPASLEGWDFYTAYKAALKRASGREISLVIGNDGNMAALAESKQIHGQCDEDCISNILLLAPGTGLGVGISDNFFLYCLFYFFRSLLVVPSSSDFRLLSCSCYFLLLHHDNLVCTTPLLRLSPTYPYKHTHPCTHHSRSISVLFSRYISLSHSPFTHLPLLLSLAVSCSAPLFLVPLFFSLPFLSSIVCTSFLRIRHLALYLLLLRFTRVSTLYTTLFSNQYQQRLLQP